MLRELAAISREWSRIHAARCPGRKMLLTVHVEVESEETERVLAHTGTRVEVWHVREVTTRTVRFMFPVSKKGRSK